MKVEQVDEHDTVFDRHDPTFRVFVYEGTTNAVTVHAITDCSVEQALEAAEMLSRRNELLWSLAVVLEAQGPGLNWISGTDYRDRPGRNASRWRLRRQMQDRYLSARSMRGEPLLLPDGLRRIRMFPEWTGGLSLWESFSDHYPCEPGELPIPQELEQRLIEWNLEWESYGLDAERPESWTDRGWTLYERLQLALAGCAEVSPDFDQRTRIGPVS